MLNELNVLIDQNSKLVKENEELRSKLKLQQNEKHIKLTDYENEDLSDKKLFSEQDIQERLKKDRE